MLNEFKSIIDGLEVSRAKNLSNEDLTALLRAIASVHTQ
jgi:hypothetical protein